MKLFLNIVELILAGALVACILVQQKGSGLGSAFGGSGVVYSTKRGIEKIIFRATIVIAIVFVAVIIFHLFLA